MRVTITPTKKMTWDEVVSQVGFAVDHGHGVPVDNQSDVYHFDFSDKLVQAGTVVSLEVFKPSDFSTISLDSE